MMRASELRLNDLVYGIDGTRKSIVCIAAVDIYPTNKTPRIVTYGGYGYQIEHLEPIPLTPEILEKNNFKKCVVIKDNYIDLKMEPYKITEQLYILNGMCGVLVCSCDNGLVFIPLFECKYVHQLQHILEASGILQDILV